MLDHEITDAPAGQFGQTLAQLVRELARDHRVELLVVVPGVVVAAEARPVLAQDLGDRLPAPERRLNLLFSATLSHRVLELAYKSHDMAPFASDLGHDGPPFRWDPARRASLRAELDAAFFHLYDLDRDAILEEPGEIVASIRSNPDTPRKCTTEEKALVEIRAKIDRRLHLS